MCLSVSAPPARTAADRPRMNETRKLALTAALHNKIGAEAGQRTAKPKDDKAKKKKKK